MSHSQCVFPRGAHEHGRCRIVIQSFAYQSRTRIAAPDSSSLPDPGFPACDAQLIVTRPLIERARILRQVRRLAAQLRLSAQLGISLCHGHVAGRAGSTTHLGSEKMETPNADDTLREDASDWKQAAGQLGDDASAQLGGKAKELTGKAQQLSSDFANVLRASAVERPFSALAIAASVGFILGALHATTRRRSD